MQILVTSPIPSHPQNHGNRARVYSLCDILQKRGYRIHFVYGGLEGLTHDQEVAMRAKWDHVYIVPHDPSARKQSRRSHHLIDDWYVPEVGKITERILNIWDIDICLANYVWFSRWLEDVPGGIPKYLDTHDMFAGRHKNLRRDGLEASWYSTTAKEERKALNRADTVLAIQSEEAAAFTKACNSNVATLGHYMPATFLPGKEHTPGGKIKVGYLASNNPINQHSLTLLQKELQRQESVLENLELHLAGAVSTTDIAGAMPAKRHGFVESPENFYADMDIILNPNMGGTGLKIKSIEALAFGKPLVATSDAMTGIETPSAHHRHQTIADLVDGLKTIQRNPEVLSELAEVSKSVFLKYQKEQVETLNRLFPSLEKEVTHA